jgi:hypothetical protein
LNRDERLDCVGSLTTTRDLRPSSMIVERELTAEPPSTELGISQTGPATVLGTTVPGGHAPAPWPP